MQNLAWRYCDRTLQLLLRTFLDIILLRKGPEHVPNSIMVLWVSCGLLVIATLMSAVLVPSSGNDSVVLSLVSSLVGYALYWMVLLALGFGPRFVRTISSIMACGSILTILMVIAAVIAIALTIFIMQYMSYLVMTGRQAA